MRRLLIIIVFSIAFCVTLHAQRITDRNTIGWFGNFTTLPLGGKWSAHLEYQWRRTEIVKHWQQSLLRVGANYQVHPSLQLRAGYLWAETFNYGEIPLQPFGKTFTEHRSFQAATFSNPIGATTFSHRIMLEQRWVGRYSSAALDKEDSYVYTNRARYMLRGQQRLGKPAAGKASWYLAAFDEVLVGFGNNVGENIFDQNRFAFMLGTAINSKFRIEAGYINQIAQYGREIGGQNVFQKNGGLVLYTYFTPPGKK